MKCRANLRGPGGTLIEFEMVDRGLVNGVYQTDFIFAHANLSTLLVRQCPSEGPCPEGAVCICNPW